MINEGDFYFTFDFCKDIDRKDFQQDNPFFSHPKTNPK